MAINKNFVVKNGLEVSTNLIFADANANKIGIGSTGPRTTLDVRGGIAATDINIVGVATISTLDGTNANLVGFTTLNALETTHLNVTGVSTFSDISLDEITARNLYVSGIATISTGIVTDLSGTNLNYSGISTLTTLVGTDLNYSGIATAATLVATSAQISNLNATGVTTIASLSVTGSTFERLTVTDYSNLAGITTIDNATGTNLNFTGVSTFTTVDINGGDIEVSNVDTTDLNVTGVGTFGIVQISSGIITATSGIVTYYGDGAYLQNLSAGIGIGTTGGLVGYGATFINFYGPGVSTAYYDSSVGIATIYFEGGGGGGATVSIGTEAPGTPTSGDLWYNNTEGRIFIYYDEVAEGIGSTAVWVDAAPFNIPEPSATPSKSSYTFTATEGQTSFSVSYSIGYIDVFVNGVRLNSTEFVENNGTSVDLVTGASAGDVIDVVEYLMGIGNTGPTGPAGPLPSVGNNTESTTHYPLIVAGLGTTAASITTTSGYLEFIPSSGTLNVNQLVVAGVTTSTAFDTSSDINLKDNVQIIENSIDKVVGIRGVTFNWKSSGEKSAGVIAQEVEQVFPEVTHSNGENMVVNYNGLIGLLVEAVKEQQVEINNLKERIEALEN